MLAWGLALVFAGIGLGLRALMGPSTVAPFLPFYPALVATTVLCGRGPAYLCAAVSTAMAWSFVYGSHSISAFHAASGLPLFALVCLIIVEMVAWLADLAARLREREALLTLREQELSSGLGELQALYDESPIGLGFLDIDMRFVRVNAALAAMNGHSVADHLGTCVWDLVPDLRASAEPLLRGVIERDETISGVELTGQTPAHPGVNRIWLESFYPVHGADGAVLGIGIFCQDVTELRQAQESERLLMREVDHRAKNLLAVVQSIVQLTRSPTTIAEFKTAIIGRIQALARVHTLLMENRWNGVALGKLIEDEMAPFGPAAIVQGAGEPLLIPADAAQALSMIVHELATNSAKYGALSGDGAVHVGWVLAEGEQILLTWDERGGPPVNPAQRSGFGMSLLRTAVGGILAGELEYDLCPDGLACRISFPRPASSAGVDPKSL